MFQLEKQFGENGWFWWSELSFFQTINIRVKLIQQSGAKITQLPFNQSPKHARFLRSFNLTGAL